MLSGSLLRSAKASVPLGFFVVFWCSVVLGINLGVR